MDSEESKDIQENVEEGVEEGKENFNPDGFTEEEFFEEDDNVNNNEKAKEDVKSSANNSEEKAKRMGWVEKERFRGDKSKWVDADEFVERGETELPILRERLRKMDGTVVGLKSTISEMRNTFSEFRERQKKLTTSAYERALKDIKQKQRLAVEEGDTEAFDVVEADREELEKKYNQEKSETLKNTKTTNDEFTQYENEAIAEFDNWRKENSWYDKNPILQSYASNLSVKLQNARGLTGTALYNAVRDDVRDRFPEEFPDYKKIADVVGDGDYVEKSNDNKKGREFKDLPKEAQKECIRITKTIPGYTRKDFLNDYEW
jgi:hypothetical protein